MVRYLICLANSRKYSGRCVAGVELLLSNIRGQRYEVKHYNGYPAWIRPISGNEFGQVDEYLVEDINLLDIIKVEALKNCPEGYQSENVLFEPESIAVVESVSPEERLLDKLISPIDIPLFGNDSNALSPDEIKKLGYSLAFIKPEAWACHFFTNIYGKKVRMKFTHNKIDYDLPITDLDFCETFENCPTIVESYKRIYLAISLGKYFKGSYYKLVAGVIGCKQ
jgi:hypothetical protein